MRRNLNVGPQGQVQYMTALNAGQNIGGNMDYVDTDNFFPADGMPVNDYEFSDLTDTNTQVDRNNMIYDNDLNDLGNGSDFFDGDYQNSYADGYENEYYEDDEYFNADNYDYNTDDDDDDVNDYEDFDDEYDDYYDNDYDSVDGETFDYATGKKRKRRKNSNTNESLIKFGKQRLDKRDERVAERRKRREERQDARRNQRDDRKTAKTDEKKSRNELTRSMAQPDDTAQILASLQQPQNGTKSSNITPAKKGLSTGAIIGISIGSIAILGLVVYLVLKKKK